MMLQIDSKSSSTASDQALVAQGTEQRFPKPIRTVPNGRRSQKQAPKTANSLETVTSNKPSCVQPTVQTGSVFDADEYTGKRLRPLWSLAKSTGNRVLSELVLRYEAEREGVAIGGRRTA